MTYDEAMTYVRDTRRELRQAAGDSLDTLYDLGNRRTKEDPKFAEALQMIGFRLQLEEQVTRH